MTGAPYRLYYFPGNANLAPHMILEAAGQPYELLLVDRKQDANHAPAYLKLNPNGRLPTLEHDGLVIYEAAAICLYLLERHPECGLMPAAGTPARAHFYQWLMYLTNTVQTATLSYYYPYKRTTDKKGAAAVKDSAEQRLGGTYGIISQALAGSPYLAGASLTAADFYLAMLCRWGRGLATPPRAYPHIARLLDELAAHPAVIAAFTAEGLEAPYF